jgi:hypothetical protein
MIFLYLKKYKNPEINVKDFLKTNNIDLVVYLIRQISVATQHKNLILNNV